MIINSTFNVLTTELAKTLIRQDEGGNKVLKNRDTDVLKHRRAFSVFVHVYNSRHLPVCIDLLPSKFAFLCVTFA